MIHPSFDDCCVEVVGSVVLDGVGGVSGNDLRVQFIFCFCCFVVLLFCLF